MIEIYTLNIKELIAKVDYQNLLSFVSKDKKERISKFRFIEDAKRTLYGDILARYLACKKLNICNEQLNFQNNKFGKPYLKNYPDFHFNISHSGDWVVCATSNKEVGIDVEQIKPIDLDIAKRFFSNSEYQDLIVKEENIQTTYFYDIWTLKESYIKYIGKGLSMSLDSFSIVREEDKIRIQLKECITPNLMQYPIDTGYKLSICGEEIIFDKNIQQVKLKEIFKERSSWISEIK